MLIGAYFVFFNNLDNKDHSYSKCYTKLVNREVYEDNLDNVSLSIVRSDKKENNLYDYVFIFDGVSEKLSNVKIMVVDSNYANRDGYYPSFGIIDNKGYSLINKDDEKGNKEIKGINLAIVDSSEIDYVLIYFSYDNIEKFVNVKVSNYLI